MSARTTELTTGKEIYLQVKKTSTFVTVGCSTSIDYSGQIEMLIANCTAGKTKIPSGDDPEYTVAIQGFHFVYASANVATNVSASEFEGYFLAKSRKEFQLAFPHTGDPLRTFFAYISDFKLAGEVNGLVTYNITLTFDGIPVITAQV